MLHKVVNCGSDLLLVIWVLGGDSLEDWEGLREISLLDAGWLIRLLHRLLHYWGTHLLWNSHLLNWLSDVLTHLPVLAHWIVLLWSSLRATCAVSVLVIILLLTLEVGVALLALNLIVTLHGQRLWSGSTSLLAPKMGWELLQNAGKAGKEVLLVDSLRPLLLSVLLSELTETNFVRGLFVLELSNLFNLVMVDHKWAGLACDLCVVELFLSSRGSIWFSEADEAEEILLFTFLSIILFREESYAFNFTKCREKITNAVFSRVLRNILDVQVASLL